jgi:4-hydroxy-3-polyprenylbenzoate decarboxylase
MSQKTFDSLTDFLDLLARNRSLVHIPEPVDPLLVAPALAVLTFRRGGPAFVIDQPKGAQLPLAMNIFGRQKHIEWALGRHPQEIGIGLLDLIRELQPPSPACLWAHRKELRRALAMRPKRVARSPVRTLEHKTGLDALPVVKCWPQDAAPFITWPLVLTCHPETGGRNLGTYRLQKNGPFETGMHWQIQKGAGFHYYEAEQRGTPLPVAVTLGADPVLMIASILPLPEDLDEVAFAGFLRGKPVPMVKGRHVPFDVPASAEILLEGEVPPRERKAEGPFGDHFGHYSRREEWPVFQIKSVTSRKGGVYPATIVGPPPLEDAVLGDAVQQMLSPLLGLMHPEVRSLWSYMETGFHNLAVASVANRYTREAKKAALALLGEGQFSLTKCVVLVDEQTNPSDFDAVARLLSTRFDPATDFLLIGNTAYDSLDFTSAVTHKGSKLVLDCSRTDAPPRKLTGTLPNLDRWRGKIGEHAVYGGGVLVFQTESRLAKPLLAELLSSPELGDVRLAVALSDDINPKDRMQMLWGWFTRFEPAQDILFERAELRGAAPRFDGRMGIDATFKAGYPDPLVLDSASEKEAERLWDKYLK